MMRNCGIVEFVRIPMFGVGLASGNMICIWMVFFDSMAYGAFGRTF